jgi:hypothetical protein
MWRDELEAVEQNAEKEWEVPPRSGIYREPVEYFLWRPSDWDEIETTLRRTT